MEKRQERFMWMATPQEALDVIADLIYYRAPRKGQDAWRKAVLELDLAQVEGHEKEE